MRQTLFVIPYTIRDVPLFGWGVLVILWALISLVWLAWLVRRQGLRGETWSYVPVMMFVGAAMVFVPRVFPDGLPIRGYGVMLLLAAGAAVTMVTSRGERMGVSGELIYQLAFWLFVGGIVGARGFHVIQKWETYRRDSVMETVKAVINVPQGGLVVYGSLFGAALAFFLFVRKHRLPAFAIADLIAPGMAMGLAIGRIGCLLNGCCFGDVCDYPWAITFPSAKEARQPFDSPPYAYQHRSGWLHGIVIQGLPQDPPIVDHVDADQIGIDRKIDRKIDGGPKPGQVVVAINDQPVDSVARAQYELARSGPELTLKMRDGSTFRWTVDSLPARSRPVHPVQIYSSINAALLSLVLWAWYPFRRRDGQVLALLLTVYPVSRFLLEWIRMDEAAFFLNLTVSQTASVLILAVGLGIWVFVRRRPAAQ